MRQSECNCGKCNDFSLPMRAGSAETRNLTGAPKSVFLIDDSPTDIRLVKEALRSVAANVRLTVAMSGPDALRILALPHTYDLILLDINLPGMNGFEILQNHRPTAPVVMFTSSGSPLEARKAIEFGAKEFVQKPTELDDFISTIHSLVQRFCLR